MKKNGSFFVSVAPRERLRPSVWDPFEYRTSPSGERLKDYVSIHSVREGKVISRFPTFQPIEYRDIPEGEYLSFVLKPPHSEGAGSYPVVEERSLLFGTMRAYLGNVLVTPEARWLGSKGPLHFPVKAEFARIAPHDELLYFWWAYLKSEPFLEALPLGSGGTRPRLQIEALLQTPVRVPAPNVRMATHDALRECARQEWKQHTRKTRILRNLSEACRPE